MYTSVISRMNKSELNTNKLITKYYTALKNLIGAQYGYPIDFDRLFLKSKLNTHFNDIQEFFSELDCQIFIGGYSDKELDLLTNIEVFTNLCYWNDYVLYQYDSRMSKHKIYLNIVDYVLSSLGYELIIDDEEKFIHIVKNNDLHEVPEEVREVVISYYDYRNSLDLEVKRAILRDYSYDLESLKNFNDHVKQLSDFVFKGFNNYNIRHDNNPGTKKHYSLIDDFTQEDYHKFYDTLFNAAVSYHAYCLKEIA